MNSDFRENDMAKASSPTGNEFEIRAVVFREGDCYVAQCIEYDIAAQGIELEEALDRLELTVEAEFEACAEIGKQPKDCINPAPNYYHGLWDQGSYAIQRKGVEAPNATKLRFAFAKAA